MVLFLGKKLDRLPSCSFSILWGYGSGPTCICRGKIATSSNNMHMNKPSDVKHHRQNFPGTSTTMCFVLLLHAFSCISSMEKSSGLMRMCGPVLGMLLRMCLAIYFQFFPLLFPCTSCYHKWWGSILVTDWILLLAPWAHKQVTYWLGIASWRADHCMDSKELFFHEDVEQVLNFTKRKLGSSCRGRLKTIKHYTFISSYGWEFILCGTFERGKGIFERGESVRINNKTEIKMANCCPVVSG